MGELVNYSPSFYYFTLAMKQKWGQVTRVVFDKNPDTFNGHIVVEWCKEHCSGRFSFSAAYEVFIFEYAADAVLTKLRWMDAAAGRETMTGEAA